jgi:hypothetical protein
MKLENFSAGLVKEMRARSGVCRGAGLLMLRAGLAPVSHQPTD